MITKYDYIDWKTLPDLRWIRFPARPDSQLSDDYANGFTGAMIGLCTEDLSGNCRIAEFDYFDVQPDPI